MKRHMPRRLRPRRPQWVITMPPEATPEQADDFMRQWNQYRGQAVMVVGGGVKVERIWR